MEQSYWNGTGKHKNLMDQLQELIPCEGSVPDPRKNPKLERFRRMVNCYYDLYNNGLCNRRDEFRRLYGIAPSQYPHTRLRYQFNDLMYERVEAKMDEAVLAAAEEQGLVVDTVAEVS